jgi:signal transduction histidine kinase
MKFTIHWKHFVELPQQEKIRVASIMILLMLVSFIWMSFHIGGDDGVALFSDTIYVVAAWLGAGCALFTAYCARYNSVPLLLRYQLSWFLIGLAMFFDGLGGAYVLVLVVLGRDVPVPSLADLGYTVYYPLLFTGILLLPIRKSPVRFQPQQVLEIIIPTLGLFGVDWYGLLGPAVGLQQWTSSTLLSLLTTLSYPFWDILLLFAMVFLLWRRSASSGTLFVLLCCGGLLANIWADTGYAYFMALGVYTPGMVSIDFFWPLGSLAIGLAALFYADSAVKPASVESTAALNNGPSLFEGRLRYRHIILSEKRFTPFFSWQTIISSALLVIVVILTCLSKNARQIRQSYFLLALSGIIMFLWLVLLVLSIESQEQRRQEHDHYRQEIERLEAFDRLKGQFMMTVSHELRTPVMTIQAYLDLLVQHSDLFTFAQFNEVLQKAQHSCDGLVTLLNTVMEESDQNLDLASCHIETQCSRLQPIIERVLELIEPQVVTEQREVRVHLPVDLMVLADPLRLRQVLCNVCVNALKYSPKGTPITISCDANQDQLIIRIKDQGQGIAPQDQVYLFERFVRLQQGLASSTRGSGLGLYISRRLIEAMEGKIWVESNGIAGEGSTFLIQLPIGR